MSDMISYSSDEHAKEKVSYAKIVVRGTKEKPYYEIEYYDLCDEKVHVGYGSYNLNFVFDWLNECFEVVEDVKTKEQKEAGKLKSNLELCENRGLGFERCEKCRHYNCENVTLMCRDLVKEVETFLGKIGDK